MYSIDYCHLDFLGLFEYYSARFLLNFYIE